MDIKEFTKDFITLWKKCFSDTDEFIDHYFSKKLNSETAIYYYEEEELLSGLLMLPYYLQYSDHKIPVSYISGACTLPKARNRGVMRKLLYEAFHRMHRQEVAFSVLIPQEKWLYNYYGKFGYSTVFKYKEEYYHRTSSADSKTPVESVPEDQLPQIMDRVYSFFTHHTAGRDFYITHDKKDFKAVLKDLYLSGGKLFISGDREITGIAFALKQEEQLIVKEILYNDKSEKLCLLEAICLKFNKDSLILNIPSAEWDSRDYGMARIIGVKKVLDLYAIHHPQESLRMKITDPVLKDNNGIYEITNGICRLLSTSTAPWLELNIEELTRKLFPTPGFMNLMME